jgi:hypothetical protein
VNWIPVFEEKRARYERSLVHQGNAAYAAGLALVMAGDPRSGEWLRRAASRWRESWDAGAARDAWGRPIGALKASLLADDRPAIDRLAYWTLELGSASAVSPIGRYAAALALLALGRWPEAGHVTATLRDDDFPADVTSALAAIAADDGAAYVEAVESVIASFEARDEFLEDMRVADTALVLASLAARRGIDRALPESPLLPN